MIFYAIMFPVGLLLLMGTFFMVKQQTAANMVASFTASNQIGEEMKKAAEKEKLKSAEKKS